MKRYRFTNEMLKKTLTYFRPYKKQFLLAYILKIFSIAFSLILPIYIKKIADYITKISLEQIAFILGIIICELILESASVYIFSKMGQKIVYDIRNITWGKILLLKVKEYEETPSGELSSRIVNDSAILINFISTEIPNLFSGIIIIVGIIVIMFKLDMLMTGVFLCLLPLVILTITPISNKIFEISEQQQTLLAVANGYFAEIISQIRMIKAYSGEQFEQSRGEKKNKNLYDYGVKSAKVQAILNPLMGTIIMILLLAVTGVGLYRVSIGSISIGVLIAFSLYFVEVMQPVQTVGGFLIELQDVRGTTKQLLDILASGTEETLNSKSVIENGDIVFEHVNFGYHVNELILKDVSFIVKKGSKTAIVGESGSGKTTIFSLIEQFYIPNSGNIILGNCNINNASVSEWRKQFGYVSQDNSIISGTIKENLLYGVLREVTEEELIQVVKMAGIYNFISSLPNKFDTEVGERGIFLSGGQKQKISIARAFLQNVPNLLLDEATANLDAESEKQVQQAINWLLKGRTALVITHRLSTILDADQIIVLQNGAVSGIGKHEELYQNNSFYRKLVEQQFLKVKNNARNGGERIEAMADI